MVQPNRIKEVFEYLKHSKAVRNQQDFVEKIGSDKATVSNVLNDKLLPTNKMLVGIIKGFPIINKDWLLTGEGEMLNADEKIKEEENENYCMVPVIHIDSVGGVHSQNAILSTEYVERYIPMTGARPGDVAIYQSGNSMAPAIPSGSLLLIREVEEWRDYIGYGDVFVLLLKDERRITKEIRRYDEDPHNYYWCVSYNPDVADEELPKRFITRVWKVIKVLIDKGW